MQSEGMKYYGRTLIDEIVKMLRVANNAGELKKLADYSGDYHTPRDLTRDEFMVSSSNNGIFKLF